MATFVAHELSFEVADHFENHSVDTFVAGPNMPRVSFTIAREPLADVPLEEQAETLLAQLPAALPQSRVIARRARTAGTLPAYEARVEAKADGAAIYQRIAFVAYYDRLLVFTATSRHAERSACDTATDQWLDSLRFRKQP